MKKSTILLLALTFFPSLTHADDGSDCCEPSGGTGNHAGAHQGPASGGGGPAGGGGTSPGRRSVPDNSEGLESTITEQTLEDDRWNVLLLPYRDLILEAAEGSEAAEDSARSLRPELKKLRPAALTSITGVKQVIQFLEKVKALIREAEASDPKRVITWVATLSTDLYFILSSILQQNLDIEPNSAEMQDFSTNYLQSHSIRYDSMDSWLRGDMETREFYQNFSQVAPGTELSSRLTAQYAEDVFCLNLVFGGVFVGERGDT